MGKNPIVKALRLSVPFDATGRCRREPVLCEFVDAQTCDAQALLDVPSDFRVNMTFTGRYDHVIDEKGRLAIPSQLRNQLNPEIHGTGFYLMQESRYLQLVPEKAFEELSSHVRPGLLPPAQVAKARRFLFSMTTKLDPDKQGRVMIPDGFMRDSKSPDPLAQTTLNREVTLVGNGDRIEIWNREEYLNHMREAKADLPSFLDTLHQLFGEAPAVVAAPAAASDK
jgi:MraZ protein